MQAATGKQRTRVWADVNDDTLEALRIYAEKDDRPMAWIVRTAVEQYVNRRRAASPSDATGM